MASDEEYIAFLDKANQDVRGAAAPPAVVQLKSVDRGVPVPQALEPPRDADDDAWVYVSEADEPFVPVALRFEDDMLPDEETFAKLVEHPSPADAAIDILDVVDWDSKGRYRPVVGAARDACQGADLRVYRVPVDRTRVEYFLVGVDRDARLLLGFKAPAIES